MIEKKQFCNVNALLNTPGGLVAVLDFQKEVIVKVGMLVKNSNGMIWRIAGVSMPALLEKTNFKFTPRFSNLLFNCLLMPIDHLESLNENDLLSIV